MKISQKDVWLVEFEPQVGEEMMKTRPAIVVSSDIVSNLNIYVIVPITTWREHFANQPWKVKLANYAKFGLDNLSAADCFQIKSFSQLRFKRKLGEIDDKTLFALHQTIAEVLNPLYEIKNKK